MYKSKVLVILVLLLFVLSVSFQYSDNDVIATDLKSVILPLIALLYFLNVKNKSLFFSLFLLLFSVSEIMVFITPYIPYAVDYYLGNTLYILAYGFLIIEISKSISLYHVLRHFKIHVLVLAILNIYIINVLQVIVGPYVAKSNEYYVELIYNIVMLLLLTVALLNYFYKDNVKALYLFIGALCIVFAEVIWVAYSYISERHLLHIISKALFILAYYFFYKQSKIEQEVDQEEIDMLIN